MSGVSQLMAGKDDNVKILLGDERMNYKPNADIPFSSPANVFGNKSMMVALTDVDADRCEAGKSIKQKGALLWADCGDTTLIYGMPMAVTKANLVDEVLFLDCVGQLLCELK